MEALLTPLAPLVRPGRALAASLLVSAALLAGAHAFQRVGGMAPCLLCLDQREAHWAALSVALVMLVFARLRAWPVVAAGLGALALLYAFSAGLAGYHAGVEWGFWEGPAGCAAGDAAAMPSPGDLIASLDAPAAGPSCSEAAWRLLGVSMAGYNALASAGLAVLTGLGCLAFSRRRLAASGLRA